MVSDVVFHETVAQSCKETWRSFLMRIRLGDSESGSLVERD